METYNLIDANGYIVFECNGKNILVDLGMPFSVSRQPIAFSICNNNWDFNPAIGRFCSPVFEVPIAFVGHEFKILCAPQHPTISQSVC